MTAWAIKFDNGERSVIDPEYVSELRRDAWARWEKDCRSSIKTVKKERRKGLYRAVRVEIREVEGEASMQAEAPQATKDAEVWHALVIAEAALADIGDADREPGDDVAWCEARAAQALPTVRAALAARQQESAR